MANALYTLIIYPLYQLMELIFVVTNRIFKNPGISVLCISVAVTLFCLPLYIVAERWQEIERNIEKALKPGVDRIKKGFKGDEQYMILSTYYRQNHYHPMMALRSSFGLLIQIPFFIAAYSFLSHLPVLKGFSFLFIRDMGVPDAMFHIGSFPVNVLPIAMTIINIIAGAIYTKGFPVKEKVQIYGMALIFLVLLYGSPSGLVLYWTMNNIFSLIKNIFYKLKNPVRVLYYCFCGVIALLICYLLFINGGSFKKRVALSFATLFLLPIPLYVKFVEYLINGLFKPFLQSFKKRTLLFFVTAAALAVLYGIVLPASLIGSSVDEFSSVEGLRSPLLFVFNTFLQSAGIFIVWPVCIYFLFHEKIQTIISTLFSFMLVWSIINAFCFAGTYGSMNNTLTFIDGMRRSSFSFTIINIEVLAAGIALVIILFRFLPKLVLPVFGIICISFAASGVLSCTKVSRGFNTYSDMAKKGLVEADTVNPLIHLSKTGKNVVVLMLDRAESAYVERIFAERPELLDSYTGFTFYKNTVSFNGHTLQGAPALWGGYDYTPYNMNQRKDVSNREKTNEADLMLARVFSEQAGYSATITDMPWANFSYVADMSITDPYPLIHGYNTMSRYTSIWKKQNPDKYTNNHSTLNGIKRNLLWISLFRCSPDAMRSLIYYNGTWWSADGISDIETMLSCYSVLDYLRDLTDFNAEKENTFTGMDNETTHCNYVLTGPDYTPSTSTEDKAASLEGSGYTANIASYILVGKWLDYLKKNGCYDNTRIIIVSDHGIGYGSNAKDGFTTPDLKGYAKDHLHPILFEKDFGAQGRMTTDMSFMTTADVPSMAIAGIKDDAVNPFTGNKITSDSKEKDGAIVSISNRHQPGHHVHSNYFTIEDNEWYTVRNSIFEDNNWKEGTGK